ncbi:MAG: DUF3267 domain-containing protein [Anaerolineae bacterium]|nr:DUF3267 domain-containing protein [Anaerolineae bacterium]
MIPHELLHVIGYRLVGQPCRYEWGQPFVTANTTMKRWQNLVGLLFPFAIFLINLVVVSIFLGLAGEQVKREGTVFWFFVWLSIFYVAAIYLGSTIGDLRKAYLLIKNKPWYAWTPFDFFYQPLVDWNDIRHKVESGEIDAEQD